jgi:hypothetical protein
MVEDMSNLLSRHFGQQEVTGHKPRK